MNLLTPEQRARHELGHAIVADRLGRPFRRIEWIVDVRGDRARAVCGTDQVLTEPPEGASSEALDAWDLIGRAIDRAEVQRTLRIQVAGVVALLSDAGKALTIEHFEASPESETDFELAFQRASALAEGVRSASELVTEAMGFVAQILSEDVPRHLLRVLVPRLVERRPPAFGLSTLDSREFDEVAGAVEAEWFVVDAVAEK